MSFRKNRTFQKKTKTKQRNTFVITRNRHLYVNKIKILSYMDNADSSSVSGQWAKSKHLRC